MGGVPHGGIGRHEVARQARQKEDGWATRWMATAEGDEFERKCEIMSASGRRSDESAARDNMREGRSGHREEM